MKLDPQTDAIELIVFGKEHLNGKEKAVMMRTVFKNNGNESLTAILEKMLESAPRKFAVISRITITVAPLQTINDLPLPSGRKNP